MSKHFHVSDLNIKYTPPPPQHNTHTAPSSIRRCYIKQLVSFSLLNKIVKTDIISAFVKLLFVLYNLNIETISIDYGQGLQAHRTFFLLKGAGDNQKKNTTQPKSFDKLLKVFFRTKLFAINNVHRPFIRNSHAPHSQGHACGHRSCC